MIVNTYPIFDSPLSRSAPRTFAPPQPFLCKTDRSPGFRGGAEMLSGIVCEHSLGAQVVFLSFLRDCKAG